MTAGLRIAFVTSEYVTEKQAGGGLATYVDRITKALVQRGHEPHVLVMSEREPRKFIEQGVHVHRVSMATSRNRMRVLWRIAMLARLRPVHHGLVMLSGAMALSDELRRLEAAQPFDFVQSADFLAPGLFVDQRRDRPHITRCSSASDLWARANNDHNIDRWWETWLQHRALRRSEAVYAPSEFVADHYRRTLGIAVRVIRPPVLIAQAAPEETRFDLPARFHLYFGQILPLKGSDVLARALPLVWREIPEYRMIWAGSGVPERVDQYKQLWGEHAGKVQWLGALHRRELSGVLQRAEACVLPSLVDNLPNTVIESLAAGIPVIGSRGASIDELVEDGKTGLLVPVGDEKSLAAAMVAQWRKKPITRGFVWDSPVRRAMDPAQAVENLVAFMEEIRSTRIAGRSPKTALM